MRVEEYDELMKRIKFKKGECVVDSKCKIPIFEIRIKFVNGSRDIPLCIEHATPQRVAEISRYAMGLPSASIELLTRKQ